MKTFLLFVLTLAAQDGSVLDARPVSNTLMTAEECAVVQSGRISQAKDGKVQIYECRNTVKPGTLTTVAQQTPVEQPPTDARVVGALVLAVCGKPIAIQVQIVTSQGPAILTKPLSVQTPKDQEEELAAVAAYKEAGGTVYYVELKPTCVEV